MLGPGQGLRADRFLLAWTPRSAPSLRRVRPAFQEHRPWHVPRYCQGLRAVAARIFQKYVNNWGVAIILLTVLIKALFWPLTGQSACFHGKR